MEQSNLIDIGKITAVMTGSTVMGIFLGSRSGGTYVFEIGPNLMIFLTIGLVLSSGLLISNMWLNKSD